MSPSLASWRCRPYQGAIATKIRQNGWHAAGGTCEFFYHHSLFRFGMPRFTILLHQVGPQSSRDDPPSMTNAGRQPIASGPVHWDWLFEPETVETAAESKLITWATDPLDQADWLTDSVPALRLPDHRRIYLDYEGEIDGDRGTVRQLATGRYELLGQTKSCFQANLIFTSADSHAGPRGIRVEFHHSPSGDNSMASAWTLRTGVCKSESPSSSNKASL